MSTALLEPKDPSDVKDYAIEWSDVLDAENETALDSSVWGISGRDLASDATGLIVSSATRAFVAGDVGRSLAIVTLDAESTGFTAGTYTIDNVSADGSATLHSSAGANASGGVWVLVNVSEPEGLTILTVGDYAPAVVGTQAVVWTGVAAAGPRYRLPNTIITAGATPRRHQRSIVIPCVDR